MSSSSAEVLYANPSYQVRLRRLAPQAETTVPSTEAAANGYLAWVLTGELALTSTNGENTTVIKGKRFGQGENSPTGVLRNLSAEEALWLEVLYGEFTPLEAQGETEQRPWGQYTVLRDDARFKLKHLAVKPGNRLSLQRHRQREEHWMIVAGRPEITLDEQILRPVAGESVLIPLFAWHRISNPAEIDNAPAKLVEIIEVQLGDYFGEDDIERSQDDYGRAAS
jgi:mannose-6-phosphate isomerase